MRTPMRAAFRLAFAGWLGLAGLSLVAAQGRAATPPEKIFPDSTLAFLKIHNASALRESFSQSQFGQLWNDPGMKTWRDEFAQRLDEAGTSLKKTIGATYQELLDLPQGAVSLAVKRTDDPKQPVAILVTVDAGNNAQSLEDVFTKATKQSEDSGGKVATETFKGATLHIVQPPPKKDKDDGKKAADTKPEPPVVWTQQGSVFFIATGVDAAKDLVAHADGREDSLASNPNFLQAQKKLGSETQVLWFVDLGKVIDLVVQAGPQNNNGNAANAQQMQLLIQLTGLQGLKAAAGSFVLNAGSFDSVTKTVVLAPNPEGILKIFKFPMVSLRPETWVPASVSSYSTYSWDVDNAYKAIDDLVNKIQPGALQVIQQQLVGPNGGDPIDFQKDIFGPLGNRFTLINDFKKPIREDNQRLLFAVALDDSKAFQSTLSKIINLTGLKPKEREFQGTTIYDFEFTMPQLPNNPNGGNAPQLSGPYSVAVAKDTLFVSKEPTLLEQVLRGGGPGLADSAAYQSVAKEIPDKVSTLSYVRPEEQARITYDMVKTGQFEKALENAAGVGGPDMRKLAKLIDKDKLPDFAIFAKYLSPGGSYSVQDEDGVTLTGFTLRKANP